MHEENIKAIELIERLTIALGAFLKLLLGIWLCSENYFIEDFKKMSCNIRMIHKKEDFWKFEIELNFEMNVERKAAWWKNSNFSYGY